MQENTWLTTNTEKSLEEIHYFYDKGIFLFCAGEYEESIKWFDKIIAIKPASRMALGYKGLALQKLKRQSEAVQCYQKALVC